MADESWGQAAGLERGAERLFVRFGLHPTKDEAKSLAEGRPVFEDAEYITIMVPGDKQNVVHRRIREQDKQRFAQQYEQWKRGAQEQMVGTPLSEWPAITRSQVEELAYFHVKTVEQLAALSDGNALNIGPVQALKQKAKDFVEKAKGNAPLEKMRMELAERDNLIETMQRQLREQSEAIAELKKGKAK